jgi:hypothetical protein
VPDSASYGREYSHELAEYEDAILDSDVTFNKTLPLIINIAMKDILRLKFVFLVLFVLGIILAVIFSSVADEIERGKREDAKYLDELQGQEKAEEQEYLDSYEHENLRIFYGVFIIFSVIILGFTINYNYGWEIKRSTMRMLSLYPIDMNGLTLAKLLSAAVIMGIIQFCVLFLPLSSLMRSSVFPWLFTVHTMTYLVNLFVLVTAAFGSHIITVMTGRLVLAWNRLAAIMITIYLICTETVITGIGNFIITIQDMPYEEAEKTYHEYELLGQALGQFSPYHAGGRLLSNSAGFYSGGPDLHFVLIIGIALIIGGFILGKQIYLDVFIRE